MQGLQINKRTAALAAGLLLGGTASASHAAPARPKAAKADAPLARALAVPARHGWASAIVKTRGPLTAAQQARMRELGADVTRRLPIINSVELRVPARSLARLAALPFVTHLSADGAVTKCDEFTVEGSGAAAAAQAPYNLTGSGVTVAVVDSGIIGHDDLAGRVLASVDETTTQQGPGVDLCGHGTHVAGLIAGDGTDSLDKHCFRTFTGVAPKASLVSVRVLDGQGRSTVGTVVAGLQWVVANRARYNIRVINLSLGHPVGESYTTDPLCQAVEAAYRAGIVVVCAAGNDGRLNGSTYTAGLDNEGWGTAYGSINSPGNDPYVITVGAMKGGAYNPNGSYQVAGRSGDRIATYSGRGPSRLDLVLKPDLVAPGNRVISLDAQGSLLDTTNGGVNQISGRVYRSNKNPHASPDYFCLSGTSMAAPVVAGAAALLLQANPSLTPDTVKARMMLSADKWTQPDGSADPFTYGAGYLDIPAALACTAVPSQPVLSPGLAIDASGNVSVTDLRAIWGHASVWGTGVTDLRAIWGRVTVAGTSTTLLSASRALWGHSSVWSDRVLWGSTSSTASNVDISSIALHGDDTASTTAPPPPAPVTAQPAPVTAQPAPVTTGQRGPKRK